MILAAEVRRLHATGEFSALREKVTSYPAKSDDPSDDEDKE
jgi:hypothetical protein